MTDPTALYLDLLKRSLTDFLRIDDPMSRLELFRPKGRKERIVAALLSPIFALTRSLGLVILRDQNHTIFSQRTFSAEQYRRFRTNGLDQPVHGLTMIGLRRLDNLQFCIETILRDNIPGDILEAGVWRGGASIFAKGVLASHGDIIRKVWVADSFRGLPAPDPERFPADRGANFHLMPELAIPRSCVQENFATYHLLDERVLFIEGWFKDTLSTAPVERLAVLRLDGDLYESTMDILDALYDKVSPGGFIIVDDYEVLACCRAAVSDFRTRRAIADPIMEIDGSGVFWRKS